MTRVKICGITNLDDALAAAGAGADLLGLNFYPGSPRYVEPKTCRQITAILHREFPSLILIGVFVNSPEAAVREILDACALDLAQLHGDESPELVAGFDGRAFKAVRVAGNGMSKQPLMVPEEFAPLVQSRHGTAPALLVDASVRGVYGGSGQLTNWSAAAALAPLFPVLLAGGLTPANVGLALRQVHPWGVDTASGVEIAPGRKDPAKMQAFVDEVRRLDTETSCESHGQETREP